MIGGTEATVNVTSRERGNKARIPDSFSLSPFDAIFFFHSFLGGTKATVATTTLIDGLFTIHHHGDRDVRRARRVRGDARGVRGGTSHDGGCREGI